MLKSANSKARKRGRRGVEVKRNAPDHFERAIHAGQRILGICVTVRRMRQQNQVKPVSPGKSLEMACSHRDHRIPICFWASAVSPLGLMMTVDSHQSQKPIVFGDAVKVFLAYKDKDHMAEQMMLVARPSPSPLF